MRKSSSSLVTVDETTRFAVDLVGGKHLDELPSHCRERLSLNMVDDHRHRRMLPHRAWSARLPSFRVHVVTGGTCR